MVEPRAHDDGDFATQDLDPLDLGLQAAFADSARGDETNGTLARIEGRFGIQSRVLLRDDPDGEAPVVTRTGSGTSVRSERYQVHGEIARGGVGVVLKGRDVDLGRDVAMKVLQARHAENPRMVQRFVEEAQIAGQLQHPGILPVYELGLQADSRPYFTMKLVKGRTLQAILADRRGIDRTEDQAALVRVFLSVCQTVAYAHARGVVHRDLKPSNVMVGAFGEVQVVDWGLAKVIARGGVADERAAVEDDVESIVRTVRTDDGSQSLAGSVLGTPAYMAPEQARGEVDRVDERTDVFALGGMLCEVLCGRPPYAGSADDMLEMAAEARLEPARARLESCPADRDLVALALHCLAPSRVDRPRHAEAVAEAVMAHQAGIADRAHRAEIEAAEAKTRAAHERRARRRTLAFTACVVVVVAVAAVVAIIGQQARERRTRAVNDTLAVADALMSQARAAAATDESTWPELRLIAAHLRAQLATEWLDADTIERGETFLAIFDRGDRDRRMIELVEDLVVFGATHEDRQSWQGMERELRGAYADYGLDLERMTGDGIADAIRSSPLAAQLTNGLELWVATVFQLQTWNANSQAIEEMMTWIPVLLAADPHPYRSAVRRILYAEDPSLLREELDALAHAPEFERALPTTQSWLAATYWRAGDVEAGIRLYERALEVHPSDMMLNFDHAYFLVAAERWQEAIRYYHRALALRPDASGVWRSLGRAYRAVNELEASVRAFDRSIAHQGSYAQTWVDRGVSLQALGDLEGAIESHRHALELDDSLAIGYCRLGLALQEAGALESALAALLRGHALGAAGPFWPYPSQEWIDACAAVIQDAASDLDTP